MSTLTYFLWRSKKNISTFWLQKVAYLGLCSTFNIKTIPASKTTFRQYKSGLNPSLAEHNMPCLSKQCRSRSVGF